MNIYWLDLVGVFAFAFMGARLALEKHCNFLGVFTFGFLTAVGGGTIRELMINHVPFYFFEPAYFFVILLACVMSFLFYRQFREVKATIVAMDALGTVAFAYIGANAAVNAHLGISGVCFFALLTACGGGVLCELVAQKAPRAFHDGLYTVPPVLLGGVFWILKDEITHSASSAALLLVVSFTVQLMVVNFGGMLKRRCKKSLRRYGKYWLKIVSQSEI